MLLGLCVVFPSLEGMVCLFVFSVHSLDVSGLASIEKTVDHYIISVMNFVSLSFFISLSLSISLYHSRSISHYQPFFLALFFFPFHFPFSLSSTIVCMLYNCIHEKNIVHFLCTKNCLQQKKRRSWEFL